MIEECIAEQEGWSEEMNQKEVWKDKRMENTEAKKVIIRSDIFLIAVPEGKKKETRTESTFKRWVENIPERIEDINLQI